MKPVTDGEVLRAVMRQVPSPVTVVTVATSEGPRGVTIGSFGSVSLQPPLVSFNLSVDATIFRHLVASERYAVHILHAGQVALSQRFAEPDRSSPQQFEGLAYRELDGLPLLDDFLAVLICRRVAVHPAGDHVILVGQVERIEESPRDVPPILYYRQSYRVPGDPVAFAPGANRASSDTP
jgi:flavin reductase (DIM6/NTAB) family NADH-FMN oxidoreductase RutF